jgi:transcriptional regulator with XRE-family HTH domain
MINSIKKMRALGEFLRKHRELVAEPAKGKQAAGRRRRTPGLRREEVAQMAGISPTWNTRLEQGKEITPSSTALARIADALHLVPAERAYLFHLAGRVDPSDVSNFEDELVFGTIEKCVLSISYPAYVLDKYWTPVFWNVELAKIFSLWLEGPEINLLRHMFVDPNARTFVADWELRARQLLAQFRIDFGKQIDDPKMLELVRGLNNDSDFFRRVWGDQQVSFRDGNEKSYNHPQLGLLKFSQTTFLAAAEPSLKLVILTPRR